MVNPLPTSGPGDGIYPGGYTVTATNRTGGAVAKNDIVMFDLAQSATEVDNSIPGSSDAAGNNSGLNNFVDPATAQIKFGIFGVVLEDGGIADDASGEIGIVGTFDVNTVATIIAGDAVCPANGSNQGVEDTGSTGAKIIAIGREAASSNVTSCLFDGWHGFGADAG